MAFDFRELERSLSRSLGFQRLISRKGTELGHVLLLDANGKSHMESPIAPSNFTLGNLVRSQSKPLRLRTLIESYMESPIV